ncbi:MAG: hypothetical protein NZ941_04665 [Candidatus Caldarchaeum sp.]|nr:hypothetical protein [Candidatus Caldarchaeum sp.]
MTALQPLHIVVGELDKRITSQFSSIRSELQHASWVAVLEAKLADLEKRLSK